MTDNNPMKTLTIGLTTNFSVTVSKAERIGSIQNHHCVIACGDKMYVEEGGCHFTDTYTELDAFYSAIHAAKDYINCDNMARFIYNCVGFGYGSQASLYKIEYAISVFNSNKAAYDFFISCGITKGQIIDFVK